jgi:hypothetical protein
MKDTEKWHGKQDNNGNNQEEGADKHGETE